MNRNTDEEMNQESTASNPGKKYWLSLRDRAGTPEYRALVAHEFPDGTAELFTSMNRRTFMTVMGASMALAGLTSCRRPEEEIVPYVSRPEEITLGNALQYATSMTLGTEVHSLLVTAREGRPVHISGNALEARGGSGAHPWASASILDLYDPDRSQHAVRAGLPATVQDFIGVWTPLSAKYAENGGTGLALLLRPYASPTMTRLVDAFRAAFPAAVVAVYDPVSDAHMLEGHRRAFGRALRPVFDFTLADVVVALDADLFGTEYDAFGHARDFAAQRRVTTATDTMNRLYVVEPGLSQTAALADHRLRIPASRIPGVAAALLHALAARGLAVPAAVLSSAKPGTDADATWIDAVAEDLLAHRGRGIVAAGRGQDPAVHALVAVINALLGNAGQTVQYAAQPFAAESDPAALADLTMYMRAGKVETLVILGGNPVYDGPADLDFRGALTSVGTSIHAGTHRDETARACTWHLPLRHYLEAWGDVSSMRGHLGIVQPLIAPLYADGISDIELLALLSGNAAAKGVELVKATWQTLVPGMNERAWRGVLHDGTFPRAILLEAPAPDASTVAAALRPALFAPPALSPTQLEVTFRPSFAVHDGRFANNGWLQEFPDPVTKLTWDNAAILSRRTAAALGLKDGDLVRLSISGRETPMPIWTMPGHADHCVTLTLGYGRMNAGRVGTGAGFNAYRLRTSMAMYHGVGLTAGAPFATHDMACVQDHHGLDVERMAREGIQERLPQLYREGTLAEYRTHPDFAKERVEMLPLVSSWDEHPYDRGHQWGMSIDLNTCIGCGACTIACQSENNIPVVGKRMVMNGREMHWIRIDRYFTGDVDNPGVRVMPVGCQHCEMAPCEQVCPVAATSHDEEGLNVMTYNRCIGTRYCSNNCPYKVRRFNFHNYTADLPETVRMAQNPDVTVRFRGVMEKCTYCTQRIERGKIAAKRDGRPLQDGDISPACEQSCPTRAIVFGDINDPASRVTAEKKRDRDYALLGEFNLRPRTTFLARLRNPNPRLG